MRTTTALVSLGLLAACMAAQESKPAKEWVRDSDDYFLENAPREGNGLPRYIIKHVVDADTGEPIAGATVDVIYGVPGASRESVSNRSTVSGEDGWARVRIDDIRHGDTFFYVQADAPGHSPWCREGGRLDDDAGLELQRAPDIRVELIDCVGRPIAGATIVCAYFRRFPLRTIVTDQDGHAVLPSTLSWGLGFSDGPNLFVESDGRNLGVTLQSIPTEAGAGPLVLRCPCRAPVDEPPAPERAAPTRALTTVSVIVEGFPDDGQIEVVGEGLEVTGSSGITHASSQPFDVAVPSEGRCALLFFADMRSKIVEVPESARKAPTISTRRQPIRVQWFQPSVVRFRLAAPDGTPVSGRASVNWRFAETNGNLFARLGSPHVEPPPASETHEITTSLRGPVWLTAVATDRSLRAVSRRIVLADEGGIQDLGEIRFATKNSTSLRVLRPDGSPAAGARVIIRHFGHRRGWWEPEQDGSLSESQWWSFQPNAGMVLQLDAIDYPIAVLRRPEGQGPWSLRFPRSRIDVSVRDATGAPIDKFWVRLDRFRLGGSAGDLVIPGVEPGPHRLIVVAPGFRARIEQLQLLEGERRLVSAVLHSLSELETQPSSRR